MTKFVHLHVHSHYSLLDGLSKINEIVDYVKEQNMDAVAVTDHGVLYGAVEFFKKAKEAGIKPIIGSEVYVAFESMDQKRPNIDDKKYHLVLLAKNETGYKNLVKLITKAHLEGFYYKPRIDEQLLEQHSEGLIALSACLQGKIPQLILAKKNKEAEETALKYQKMFGQDSFYLEIQSHPNIKEQEQVNKAIIALSEKLNIPLVATCDSHYLRPDDAEAQDILMLINTGADKDDPERLSFKEDDFSMKPPEEMAKIFKNTPQAIENTVKIADLCNFEFKLGEINLPKIDVPNNTTPIKYLTELCNKNLAKKYNNNQKQAQERLKKEISAIEETGFASYFLMVADFVNWAKTNRIVVGPGRGSVGGSIVAYLLNITNVDPLKYDLLFERFLNKDRVSMPDIDLDFTDRRRNEVINYITEKYGREQVAQIITFGTMAARAAIRDVGRALGYPYNYCDKIAKMIPFGFNLKDTLSKISEFKEIYESDEQAKKLIDFAKKLEGVVRHASTHACGIVISDKPLVEITPLQFPTQNDEHVVTQYEMKSIEDLGLLKMDILGLKNLTIIEDTLSRIYAIYQKNINIEELPENDKKVFSILQKGETTGIFQLESEGVRRYLKQLKPTEFEDIIAMVALYRPGPMQLIPDYIARKNKQQKVEYLHPSLKPILEKTYGIPIYQEQIMKIANDVAGFSLSEADVLRKAIGKKIKKLLMDQKEKFIKGIKNNNISEKIGQEIWNWIEPTASYSFNRSHAAAYATIAYQTAYLKAHYPKEFMSSLLTADRNDTERIADLIEECRKTNIEVLPPDINESFSFFSVVPSKNQIRFGLSAIKNVGLGIVEEIIAERKKNGFFKSLNDFVYRTNSKVLNKKSFESLARAGVFDNMIERNQILSNMETILDFSRSNYKNKVNGQKSLFEGNGEDKELKLPPAPPAKKEDKLKWEKELLGLFITSHPLEDFKKVLEQKTTSLEKAKREISGQRIIIGGIISKIKKIITRNGKPMLFLGVEDMTDKIEVVVFPKILERNPTIFQENKIAFITGRVDHKDNVAKIICDQAEEILEI